MRRVDRSPHGSPGGERNGTLLAFTEGGPLIGARIGEVRVWGTPHDFVTSLTEPGRVSPLASRPWPVRAWVRFMEGGLKSRAQGFFFLASLVACIPGCGRRGGWRTAWAIAMSEYNRLLVSDWQLEYQIGLGLVVAGGGEETGARSGTGPVLPQFPNPCDDHPSPDRVRSSHGSQALRAVGRKETRGSSFTERSHRRERSPLVAILAAAQEMKDWPCPTFE